MAANYRPYQAVDRENSFSTLEQRRKKLPIAPVEYELEGQASFNILSYDTRTLITYGWIFPYRGSIFHRKIFFYIGIQLILSTLMAKYKCDESDQIVFNSSNVFLCVPLPDSMTALTLLTVTSFIVGLFTNNLMQRWWAIRAALNNVKSKSTNLVNAFTASVAVNTKYCTENVRKQAINMTQTLKRYLQLAHALIYIRGNPRREYETEHCLEARYLLTEQEAELLMRPPQALFDQRISTEVYAWVSLCLEMSSTSGILGPVPGGGPAQHVVTFFNELSLIQSAAADVDMYITTQLPYPFIQMTALLVYMFLFQLFFVTTGVIGDGFSKDNPAVYITGYCTQVLMSFLMLGVLHLYLVLCNPIGPDGADFPTSTYVLQYEEQTNFLVKNIWTASCPSEQVVATQKMLNKSLKEQLDEGVPGGGLPIVQSFTLSLQDIVASTNAK